MLLQRGPVILSPGNPPLPQSVENVEPKISQIVDNLIEISCKEDVLNGNHRSTSSSSSSSSADTEDEQNLQINNGGDDQNLPIHEQDDNRDGDEKPWQTSSVEMEDAPQAPEDARKVYGEDLQTFEDASPALTQTNMGWTEENGLKSSLNGETGVMSQEMNLRFHDEVIIETTVSTEIRQETFIPVEGPNQELNDEESRENIQADVNEEIAKQTQTPHTPPEDVVEHETNNETHPSSGGVKDEPQTEIEPAKVEKVDKQCSENKDTLLSDVTVQIDNHVATGSTKHVRATDLRGREMEEGTGDNDSSMDSYETQLEKSLELTCASLESAGRSPESPDRGAPQSIVVVGEEGADTPVRASIHRVTFNTRNEVASEDKDGSLLVTYLPLEQRIKERSPLPGREPIKVKYVERTNPLASAARIIDFNDSTFVEHTQDNLNPSREGEEEGWENPFQPEGEVSHDADLILRLWKGGNLHQDLEAAITKLQEEEEEEAKENSLMVEEETRAEEKEEKEEKEVAELNPSPPSSKPSPGSKAETRLVPIDKQKHKNLLKKACSLM